MSLYSFPCSSLHHLYLLVVLSTVSPLECELYERKPFALFMAVSHHLEQCGRYWIGVICWMNKCILLLPSTLPFISQPSTIWWLPCHPPPCLKLVTPKCFTHNPVFILLDFQDAFNSAYHSPLLQIHPSINPPSPDLTFPSVFLGLSSRVNPWCHFFTLDYISPPLKSGLVHVTYFVQQNEVKVTQFETFKWPCVFLLVFFFFNHHQKKSLFQEKGMSWVEQSS